MARSDLLRGVVVPGLLALALSCQVTAPSDAVFSCTQDADCGGDGYVCALRPGTSGLCCRPVAETCDGQDEDCDQRVDNGIPPRSCYSGPAGTEGVGLCKGGQQECTGGAWDQGCPGEIVPQTEQCNGLDDDCNGTVDDGFDLSSDDGNCGRCGNGCGPDGRCANGECVASTEISCGDGLDNDADGQLDCADSECDGQSCGGGCACMGGAAVESDCGDGADNDRDLEADCADVDCDQQICGQEAHCSSGMCASNTEVSCQDGVDNDLDGLGDCSDPECDAQSCGPGCVCASAAAREADCQDGLDNDGDQTADCADADCDQQSCGTDAQCNQSLCVSTREVNCEDGVDDDLDGLLDCADPECDGLSCGTGCTCVGSLRFETSCSDGVDNDGDLSTDCLDPDCAGQLCQAAPSSFSCDAQLLCSCHGTQAPAPEALCADGSDDDCDGVTDCADGDCNGASCGTGCACANGVQTELIASCGDFVDNDGDGLTDCADDLDCPAGTACQYRNGPAVRQGTCSNAHKCR